MPGNRAGVKTVPRRLRGAFGLGLTWGAVWAVIFALISVVVGILKPEEIDAGEGPMRVGAIGGGIGLVSGVLFGLLLSLAESGKPVREISPIRAAMWGILASAVIPIATGRSDQVFVLCPIGAAVAIAAVALARREDRQEGSGATRVPGRVSRYVVESVRSAVSRA